MRPKLNINDYKLAAYEALSKILKQIKGPCAKIDK
jgi:hypothetical protein